MKLNPKTIHKTIVEQQIKNQIFIMMVGFSQAGKSTLAKKIAKEFDLVRIDSDSIHDFLNKTYKVFQDDKTIKGKSYDLRQKLTYEIKEDLIKELIKNGNSIILDSCNLSKISRSELLKLVKKIQKNITTIIVFVNIPELILYKNLRQADKNKKLRGQKTAWLDLYEKLQKNKLDKPSKNEADYFFIYNYSQDKFILEQLGGIIFK